MIQFPEKFQERMQQMLGDEEYAEFLKSYDLPFHNGLRINTWKTKPQELLQRMGAVLLPPGAAHISRIFSPGCAFTSFAGSMALAS